MGGGYTWFDTGTFESQMDAAQFIRSTQNNKGKIICCPEQIGYDRGWVDCDSLQKSADMMKKNSYGQYLYKVLTKR